MKFCAAHWEELRTALRDRGLWEFVAPSTDSLKKRIEADGFEPLMGAHNAIVQNALNAVGLEAVQDNDDGTERCPVCFLVSSCACTATPDQPCPFTKWIGFAANDALEEAKRRGLVGAS